MPRKKSEAPVSEADYVVVGAGSAGCAVARRLADSGASVVLVEAGGSGDRFFFNRPGMIAMIHADPKLKAMFDWGYYHAPQPHLNNRKIPATRGKLTGGSSSVNGMIFVRGHKANFDAWEADGCTGWGYEDVLATYKRLETWNGAPSEYRGTSGPVQVIENGDISDAASVFVEAGQQALGLQQTPDYNGAEQLGMHVIQESTKGSVRYSTRKAYLEGDVPGLTVLTGATVSRVVVSGGRATGVAVREKHGTRVIKASREVIVSAGAYGSPQILQLSGIGHSDHLRDHGIDVVADLPVGDNLHDHLFVPTTWVVDNSRHKGTPAYFFQNILREQARRGSTFMAHSVFECGAFTHTSHSEGEAPDMQFLGLPWAYPAPNQDAPIRYRPDPRPALSMFSTLIQPRSRGTLRLASGDPTAAPVIDPGFLSDSRDLDVLVEGLEMIREVMHHPTMARHVKEESEFGPSYTGQKLRDEVLNRATTVYHPVGSCRMGAADDERTVVDPELRVKGIDGLRVADASVIPTIISGNTNAPSIMVGEKCAELILGGIA